jgi:hypothetical protein
MLKNSRSTLSRTSGHKHTILSPRIWNCEFCHIGYEILVFCNNWFCHLRLFFSLVRSSQFRILETKLSRVQNWGYFGRSGSIKRGLNSKFPIENGENVKCSFFFGQKSRQLFIQLTPLKCGIFGIRRKFQVIYFDRFEYIKGGIWTITENVMF